MAVTRRLGGGRYSLYTNLGEFILARGEREYVRARKGRGKHVCYWTVEKAPPSLAYDFASPLKAETKNDLIALIVREVAFYEHGWDGQPQSGEVEHLEKQLSDALRMIDMQAKIMGTMQTFIDQQSRVHEFELREQALSEAD